MPRDFRPLADAARTAGWEISTTGGDHLCWRSPSGAKVFSAQTPSDSRAAVHRHRKLLRQHGLEV